MRAVALPGTLVAVALASCWALDSRAAFPTHGATYEGRSEARDRVVLSVSERGHRLNARIRDRCGGRYQVKRVQIKKKGRFQGRALGPLSLPTLVLRGRFITKRKVRGSISTIACSPGSRDYRAHRKR